jgi:hypothetical protein
VTALYVDQNVGIEEIHPLRPWPPLRLFANSPGVLDAIFDVRARTDKILGLPIRDEFGACARRSGLAVGQKAQHVLRQGKTEPGGFGGELILQLGR